MSLFMGPYGVSLGLSMGPYSSLWILYWSLRLPVGLYGALWGLCGLTMGLNGSHYGSLWVLIWISTVFMGSP